jgi:NADH dehydrogenase
VKKEFSVVTGAFGYTGSYITRRLLARSVKVRTLTGHPARANPFGDAIEVMPFDFDHPDALTRSLDGATIVFNTYWIRFPHRGMDFERALANVIALIGAAKRVGVRKFIHISITNASPQSPLPYFRGKGLVEGALVDSGLGYAIVRPAVIFGPEEILLNNIAWLLRRLPLFAIPGNGRYWVQPVFVEDVAEIAVNAAFGADNIVMDAAGPEIVEFNQLIRMLSRAVGSKALVLHVRPAMAFMFASIIGKLMRDVLLTRDEIRGLMTDLLVSRQPPIARVRFSDWLVRNAEQIGMRYASELARRR